MSSMGTLTGKFRVQNPDSRVSKKTRPTLACQICRRNKLRCDKGQPCGSCVKRDSVDHCVYGQSDPTSTSVQNLAEERLAHLESMVVSLMQQQTPSSSSGDANGDALPVNGPPPMNKGGFQESDSYTGSTHWSAMLNDISELKASLQLTMPSPPASETDRSNAGEVLYGQPGHYSIESICRRLPPRQEVDRYLSVFFSGDTFILPIVHTNSFRRQYETFWAQPPRTNALWLSILCSISYMASRITSSDPAMSRQLQEAAGECLVLGQYSRPQRYVVEALVLYAQSKNLQSMDPSAEAGAILGVAVRHAHTMGYHRDPDQGGKFSTFEGEMRRRTYATCKQMDLMLCFQLGLPSHIRLENSDTRSPSNLLDADFDEDTMTLPKERSDEQATRLLWFIVKERLMPTFGRICSNALAVQNTSEEETWSLDAEVHRMYSTIPNVLRTRSFEDSIADSPFVIMTRIYIEFIYLKSLCVLHRRWVTEGQPANILAATDASKQLIQRFISVEEEIRPGGILEHHGWMVNSFTLNDFLLGVTTLCLCVFSRIREVKKTDRVVVDAESMQLADLLKRSLTICEQRSFTSRDATKVAHAVSTLLSSCQFCQEEAASTNTVHGAFETIQPSWDVGSDHFAFSEVPSWLADPTLTDFLQFDLDFAMGMDGQ